MMGAKDCEMLRSPCEGAEKIGDSPTSVPTLVEQNQLFGFEVFDVFADGSRK